MRIQLAIGLLVTASITGAATRARADAAAPQGYYVEVGVGVDRADAPQSVHITVNDYSDSDGDCSGSAVLLRQNIDTGELVQVAHFCDSDGIGFVDECVIGGRYRYGLAPPLLCVGETELFGVAEVPLGSGACTLTPGDAGPTPFAAAPPWTDEVGAGASNDIDYVCTGDDEGSDSPPSENTGLCSAGGSARVRAFDLTVLVGALAWTVRRRKARREDRA